MTGHDASVRTGAGPARSMVIPLSVVGAVLLLGVVGWITTPEFVTYRNFQSIVRAAALIGIVAVTMTLITIAGSFFSLSVSQTAAMSAICFAAFLSWGFPVWVAMPAVILLASAVGVVQGGAIVHVQLGGPGTLH